MAGSASSRAESRIRQLCALNIGGEAVIPSVLRELHEVIPSYSNTFYWVSAAGAPANIYDEQACCTEILPLYMRDFLDRSEKEVHPGFTHAARHARGVLCNDEFFTVDEPALLRSDFYNCIMRPQRYHYIMQLYVRDGGRTHGILQLQRMRSEHAFNTRERRRIARLRGLLAYALAPRACRRPGEWVDSGESGLILVNRKGKVVGDSPQGRRLLFLATHPHVQPGLSIASPHRLPEFLIRLCARLEAVLAGDARAGVPVHRCCNGWGRFEFRAHILDGPHGDSGLIGICVRLRVPLPVRLVRATRRYDLSERQAQTAVLLASGFSHRQISDRLGIARNTVISHSRWIYSKLGVHDSAALRERLLAAAVDAKATARGHGQARGPVVSPGR